MAGLKVATGELVRDIEETGTGSESDVKRLVSIADLTRDIHANAKAHGWWDELRGVPELLCLVHSEVSEALEAYRNHDKENFAEELADVVIRIFDMAEGLGVDIQAEVLKKHDINKQRSFRHGGKAC